MYTFYSNPEHKPSEYGELGWTRNTPERAIPKSNYKNTRYDNYLLNMSMFNGSGSEYLIRIAGFVIFLDYVSSEDIRRKIFDVEYSKDSKNGKSGHGKLITNNIRELVTNNIAEYRQLEKVKQ